MAKRYPNTRGPSVSTKIPIFTLSGGVSRQPQSKRLPSEAQNMDNALVSLERSFEKRPGFETVLPFSFTGDIDVTNPSISATFTSNAFVITVTKANHGLLVGDVITIDFGAYNTLNGDYLVQTVPTTGSFTVTSATSNTIGSNACSYVNKNTIQNHERIDLYPLEHNYATSKDYWFYWFNINDNNNFLVVIDYKATTAPSVLMYVFRIRPDGTWSNETQYSNLNEQDSTIVDADTRAYITYGSSSNKANDVLKATTIGNSIVILNTLVKAGFTSGEVNWNGNNTGARLFNLDGSESATADTKGSLVTYYSSARYTKASNSKWYLNTNSATGITLTGTATVGNTVTTTAITFPTFETTSGATNPNPSSQTKIYLVQTATPANMVVLSGWTTGGTSWVVEKTYGATIPSGSSCTVYTGYYPEVEDFIWHDTTLPWLGQSTADFSEIRFPPELAERNGNNSLFLSSTTYDDSAKTMLANLYTEEGNTNGNGKIYYTAAPYLNFTSGYYRIISSASKPYTKKVRSPDCYSVVDKRRMPQKITFNAAAAGTTTDPKWFAKPVEWEPRTSGNRYSNPGPSVFLTPDKKKPRHVQIKSISTFRDRLYFAAEDVIFTSQLGVYEDLFLADPSNIVSTDPIDIRASSNTFSEITSLTPFSTYLFINTINNVQYELKGSQNQITPLTAEISPTAFYSTARFTEPQLMGSLIYFFDSAKLYLYLSSESSDLAVAQELTVTCSDYIPNTIRSVCVASAQSLICMVDDDNPNYIYFNASRFAGDRNLQNAFFRYVLQPTDEVQSIQSYDDYLYAVTQRPSSDTVGNGDYDPVTNDSLSANGSRKKRYYIETSYLRSENPNKPRLDRLIKLKLTNNNSDYDPVQQRTTIRVPISFNTSLIEKIQFITDESWQTDISGDRSYEIQTPLVYTINNEYIEIQFSGRYVPVNSGGSVDYSLNRYLYIGIKYKMEVELSTQFVRDQTNNVIDGALNLRTMSTRHKKTGNYDISVSIRERTPTIYSFTNQNTDDESDLLNLENWEEEGRHNVNVLGNADNTTIKFISEYPSPVNIVNIEFKGKFIQKYSPIK
jgi:hypothetical protein